MSSGDENIKNEEKTKKISPEEQKSEDTFILKKGAKISLQLLSSLLMAVVIGAKIFLYFFDLVIPRELRDYVPFFQMVRTSTFTASEIMSGEKSKEVLAVSNELDELVTKQQRVKKNYPLRRGIGQAVSMGISPIVLIVIPTIIWGEGLIAMIKSWLVTYPIFANFEQLDILVGIMLGTLMLLISWIATVFGPIYVVFHKSSEILKRLGAYRWGALYQDLENLFSLPYYAVKSSFSFFDAPPISSETLEEYKLTITEEAEVMKEKVKGLLALDTKNVTERSKEMLENLLKKAEIPLEKLDLTKVTDETARTFSLLIWSKESSLIPGRRDKALYRFSEINKIPHEDARQILQGIANKLKRNEIDEYLLKSIMITGALKGIYEQEKKYKQVMTDIESNKLAIALGLGGEQYLEDIFSTRPLGIAILKQFGIFLLAILLPVAIIIYSLLLYIKHIILYLIRTIISKKTYLLFGIIRIRYYEISSTLMEKYKISSQKEKMKIKWKDVLNFNYKRIFIRIGKVLLKIIIFPILLLWSLFKSIYKRLYNIIKRRKPEDKMKRMFEKELATATLVSMYQEIYEKIHLSDLVLS